MSTKNNGESIILAIDTSCDDTSAAVVKEGKEILSNIVSSQNEIHEKFGGIVPELASRRHIEIIQAVVSEALIQANIGADRISAIAVTWAPGLIGSLIVGCNFAKAIAYANKIPLIGVHHLEGHIYVSNLMNPVPRYPFLALVVSGGHTSLYLVKGFKNYTQTGVTRDDAAGEAYDKVAKMMGFGYPGGPLIDKLACKGNPRAILFPRAYMRDSMDFSFSGLKTAVRNFLNKAGRYPLQADGEPSEYKDEDICASFQASVMDVLLNKIKEAVKREKTERVLISGGVAANSGLRKGLTELSDKLGIEAFIPPKNLCTDNAAMIGAAGHLYYINNLFADNSLNPKANVSIIDPQMREMKG